MVGASRVFIFWDAEIDGPFRRKLERALGELQWTGQWKDDEPCGHGLLETPDGRRFEGEVAPDERGAPKRIKGWEWNSSPARSQKTYSAAMPALPAPHAAG